MKKPIHLIISLTIFIHVTQAQDYKLTFSLLGEVTAIDSVVVENATKNTSVKLNGNDTLVLTKIVHARYPFSNEESFDLKVFPNPSETFRTVQFKTNRQEEISAVVYDIRGTAIVSKSWSVKQGIHSFQLENLPGGVFMVQINSAVNAERIKILSLRNNHTLPEISALRSEQTGEISLKTKSATDAQLLGYQQYDNIVVRVWPTQAPWELTRGFVMDEEEPPLKENDEFVITYQKCEDYCGNVYNTVELGDQIWMAENFKCPTENSWVYDEDENNTGTYGRLYTWEDAINNAPKGWHLPSAEEWSKMLEFIQNTYEDNLTVALKSKTGWTPDENQNPANGTNASGFNIVPAGARWFLNGSFYAMGESAYFWTSTRTDSVRANMRKFTGSENQIHEGNSIVDYGFSVRYVKDQFDYGTFTDDRDGEVYKTITYGEQTWMAENLRFTKVALGGQWVDWNPTTDDDVWKEKPDPRTTGSQAYCWYDNDESYKNIYGALYNWSAAVRVCPDGWHLPGDEEWQKLEDYLSNNGYGYDGNESYIAKAMAAASNWHNLYEHPGNPGDNPGNNNSSGFSALPGGYRSYLGGFGLESKNGFWWSSTEYDSGLYDVSDAWMREISYQTRTVMRNWLGYNNGLSVRCIKD